MKLKFWQVDAFAAKPFEGNPAAIVPLESWLPDGLMQKIANENNLAETAFFVRNGWVATLFVGSRPNPKLNFAVTRRSPVPGQSSNFSIQV